MAAITKGGPRQSIPKLSKAGGTVTARRTLDSENSYMSEATARSSARSRCLQDVDETKIEASFSKGLLTETLPKRAEAQKLAKTIAVKAAWGFSPRVERPSQCMAFFVLSENT